MMAGTGSTRLLALLQSVGSAGSQVRGDRSITDGQEGTLGTVKVGSSGSITGHIMTILLQ